LITLEEAVKTGRGDEPGLRFGWRHGARQVIDEVLAEHRGARVENPLATPPEARP
jgi:hypothetical protein